MLDLLRVVPKKRTVILKAKKGILFSNPSVLGKSIFYLGTALFFVSLTYLAYLYQPLGVALVSYYTKPTVSSDKILAEPTPTMMPVEDRRFLVSIPKISAENEIVPKVDVQSKSSYMEVLKSGKIAHALGSFLPGDGLGKSIYLFAHSTEQEFSMVRKNSVFYLLDKLENFDMVYIRYQGGDFKYRVFDKKIVSAQEAEYLSYSDPSREVLILQTCWPLGTNWKRLLVFAQKQM